MLLIDEIDRADDEFEAFLLEVLSTNQVTIPEYGTVSAATAADRRTHVEPDPGGARRAQAPVPVPLGRPPGPATREVEIVRRRVPEVSDALAGQVALAISRLRSREDLVKPPGVAESLDWARALHALGETTLDLETAALTLGAVLKYREDAERVRASLDSILAP